LKVLFGFTWKTDNDICSNGSFWKSLFGYLIKKEVKGKENDEHIHEGKEQQHHHDNVNESFLDSVMI
jgi:hypothetical protein